MPFIAQCPHPACRKFQLLEDALRGAVTHCLLCKQPLRVREGAAGPQTEAVAAPPAGAVQPLGAAPPIRTAPPVSAAPPIRTAPPAGTPPPIRTAPPISAAPPVNTAPPPRAGVAHCPKCAVELRLPWERTVRSVKCPKCGAVFSP